MSTEYNVYIAGKVAPGVDRNESLPHLEKMFRLTRPAAEKLLDGKRRVIKKNMEPQKAEKLVRALTRIGVIAGLDASSGEPIADLTPSSPPPLPRPSAEPPGTTSDDEAVLPPREAAVAEEWQTQGGWEYRIEGRPDFAFVSVRIPSGQTMKVEASAMATMDTNLVMKTKLGGGFKRFLSGESIFINEFTAEGGPGEIGIAPAAPGDMAHIPMTGQPLFLQNAAFVASTGSVEVETKWQGFTKGFFSGEGLFLIRAVGEGDLWFNTFGAMIEREVDGEYVVDNGHIVAFTEGLEYEMTKMGGYKSFFLSGEGLVCRFRGKGKLWLQTRHPSPFAGWARAFRPVKKRGG